MVVYGVEIVHDLYLKSAKSLSWWIALAKKRDITTFISFARSPPLISFSLADNIKQALAHSFLLCLFINN